MDLGELVREKNFVLKADAGMKLGLGIFWTIVVTVPAALLAGLTVFWLVRHFLGRWTIGRWLSILPGLAAAAGSGYFLTTGPGLGILDWGPRAIREARAVLSAPIPDDEESLARGLAALRKLAEGDEPDDLPPWLEEVGAVSRTKHGACKITKRGEEVVADAADDQA